MIDRDIKVFIIKTLAAADGTPITRDTLKGITITQFQHATLTHGDLNGYIDDVERQGFIAGTQDMILGPVYAITPKGKIKAQQI